MRQEGPPSSLAISIHLFPRRACAATMIASSAFVQAPATQIEAKARKRPQNRRTKSRSRHKNLLEWILQWSLGLMRAAITFLYAFLDVIFVAFATLPRRSPGQNASNQEPVFASKPAENDGMHKSPTRRGTREWTRKN